MSSENNNSVNRIMINIDMVFIVMLLLSLAMTYSFYTAWNNPKPSVPDTRGTALQFYAVDSCTFGERDISVSGWAFLPGNWKILNRVYIERKDGEMVELMSSFQPRRDVGEVYKAGNMYDKSGFIATRHDATIKRDFSQNILLVSIDEKGVGHAAKYHCK
jgi:hypothetical protein